MDTTDCAAAVAIPTSQAPAAAIPEKRPRASSTDTESHDTDVIVYSPDTPRLPIPKRPPVPFPVEADDPESNPEGGFTCWVFTIYNFLEEPTLAEIRPFDSLPKRVRYVVWSVEIAPSTGRKHIQGYVRFVRSERWQVIQKLFRCIRPNHHAWCKPANGTDLQNKAYCSKAPVMGPWEFGTPRQDDKPKGDQGKRNDQKWEKFSIAASTIPKIKDLLMHEDLEIRRMCIQHSAAVKQYRALVPTIHRERVFTYCIWGLTDTGKSWFFSNFFKNRGGIYRVLFGNSGSWADGYQGEEAILLDEYKSQLPCQKLITFCDNTPCRVESKFGSEWAAWKIVCITSNTDPGEWYQREFYDAQGTRKGTDPANIEALLRRMNPPYGFTWHWTQPRNKALKKQFTPEQQEVFDWLKNPDNHYIDDESPSFD